MTQDNLFEVPSPGMTIDELLHYDRFTEAGFLINRELDQLEYSWAELLGFIDRAEEAESEAERIDKKYSEELTRADELDSMMQTVQSLLGDVEAELTDLEANGAEVCIELKANLEHLQSIICNSEYTGDWSWQR